MSNFDKAIEIILAEPPEMHYPAYYADLLSKAYYADLLREADVPDKDAGEKTCKTCHLWEDGELNIACPWGSNYEHYEDDYCSLWEKQN